MTSCMHWTFLLFGLHWESWLCELSICKMWIFLHCLLQYVEHLHASPLGTIKYTVLFPFSLFVFHFWKKISWLCCILAIILIQPLEFPKFTILLLQLNKTSGFCLECSFLDWIHITIVVHCTKKYKLNIAEGDAIYFLFKNNNFINNIKFILK